ncbi:MAG: tetratricopeptide repeat protein [Cyclonatronaceae bacterium]
MLQHNGSVRKQPESSSAVQVSSVPVTALGYTNYAGLLKTLERYAEAESLFRETLSIDLRILGEKHPFVAMDNQAVGITLMHQGKLDEAGPHLIKGYEELMKARPDDLRFTTQARDRLADYYEATGNTGEAQKLRNQ